MFIVLAWYLLNSRVIINREKEIRMSVITFFGRKYTGAGQLAQKAAEIWGYRVVRDRQVIDAAAREYGLKVKDIESSIFTDPPLPERYTPAKAQCIAAVKTLVAREVDKGQVIFSGFLGELIPADIGLHLIVTASDRFRLRRLASREGADPSTAADQLHRFDEAFLRWSLYLKHAENRQPQDYDGVVNVSRTGQSELIRLICEAADKKRQERDPKAFRLAARVSRVMAEKGHPVAVSARGDRVNLRVNKPVMMLSRYGKKLSALARSVNGVGTVRTRTGWYRADICSGHEFNAPMHVAWQPIKHEYEQLYAQVDTSHAFVQRQATPVLMSRPRA